MIQTMVSCFEKIVLAIPHATRCFDLNQWDNTALVSKDADHWTDWFTDELFDWQHPRISSVIGKVSRFDCDLERLEKDPLEAVGRGRFYTQSHSGARRKLSSAYRKSGLEHWTEYRKRLVDELRPEALLIDCHSFPSDIDPVDICIGFNSDWSTPDKLTLKMVIDHFEQHRFSVSVNQPFSNSITPDAGFAYKSMMIELNKRIYMDEVSLQLSDSALKVRRCLKTLYQKLLGLGDP
jgi:N-formylglutamate amidohydrolase